MKIKKDITNSDWVSLIIPNFNGEKLLEENLSFVFEAFANKENKILEIIIVDDASNDGSVNFIKRNYPDIRLIKHKLNRGFPAAVNTGVRMAKGDYIALLNTDVKPSRNFLVDSLVHFKNEKVFAVSFHEKGYGWARGYFEDGFINHEQGKESKSVHETFWVSGGSGIFRRSMWLKLGGMDEKLFTPFYWEDIDISYRAAKRGWLLLWEPNSKVIHEHESTMKKISINYRKRIQERNQLIFIWKNITSPQLLKRHFAGLIKRISRHPGYLRIVFLALKKIRIVIKARRKEIKEGKISDEAIFAKFKND